MRFFVKLCVVIMGWSNSTSHRSPTAAIGDKIVETLYSNRVTSENIRIHAHPWTLSPPFKVGVFVVF